MKPFRTPVVNFLVVLPSIFLVVQCKKEEGNPKNAVKGKGNFEEENYGVKYASKCEVCKVVTSEVEFQLNSKFKSPEVIETGYNYLQDKKKKKQKYERSLLRLQEALESTCGAILEYNIHKERKDWTRFARGQSQTFKTLHGLKNKGVKVDLGIPEEMWDKPSAEVTHLKAQCETFLENNEEDIEEWYQKGSQVPLEDVICKKTLKKKERDCLAIKPLPEPTPTQKLKGEQEKPVQEKSTKEDKPSKDHVAAEKSTDKTNPKTNKEKKQEAGQAPEETSSEKPQEDKSVDSEGSEEASSSSSSDDDSSSEESSGSSSSSSEESSSEEDSSSESSQEDESGGSEQTSTESPPSPREKIEL